MNSNSNEQRESDARVGHESDDAAGELGVRRASRQERMITGSGLGMEVVSGEWENK